MNKIWSPSTPIPVRIFNLKPPVAARAWEKRVFVAGLKNSGWSILRQTVAGSSSRVMSDGPGCSINGLERTTLEPPGTRAGHLFFDSNP